MKDHPALIAWKSLHSRAAEQVVVEPLETLNVSSRVHRLVPSHRDFAVIAKHAPLTTIRVERIVYETLTRYLPAAIPQFLGCVEGRDNGWIFTAEVPGEAYREDVAADREAAARWLASLHAAAADAPELLGLPPRSADHYGRLLDTILTALGALVSNTTPGDAHRPALETAVLLCERLSHEWGTIEDLVTTCPHTLVHGDLVAHNVFVQRTPAGVSVVAIDWERAGWGNPAEDLSGVDLHSYAVSASELGAAVADADLRSLARAGRFFRCIVFLDWVVSRLDAEAPDDPLDDLAVCCEWLSRLMRKDSS